MTKRRAIEIKCRGASSIPHYQLTEYQGELKSLDRENYEKLRKMILELGFSEPICVWQHEGNNYILNGHQRLRTVTQMAEEGFSIPPLPVVFVEADSHAQAKRKLLALASQYGKVEGQGLYEYLIQSEIMPQELEESFRLPEIKMDRFMEEFFDMPQPEEPDLGGGRKFKLKVTLDSEQDLDSLLKELDERGYSCEILP